MKFQGCMLSTVSVSLQLFVQLLSEGLWGSAAVRFVDPISQSANDSLCSGSVQLSFNRVVLRVYFLSKVFPFLVKGCFLSFLFHNDCRRVCVCASLSLRLSVFLTVAAPVLHVDPPALLLQRHVLLVRVPLRLQLGVDPGHGRRVQRDVAQLGRSAQAEHAAAQRRPERVQVPRRVARGRTDPEQLEARLHAGQHG